MDQAGGLRWAILCGYWANSLRQVPCDRGRIGGRGGRRARPVSVIPGIIFVAARPDVAVDPWPITDQGGAPMATTRQLVESSTFGRFTWA
jgi:hypothetical protein